jgi:lipopolysaccharide export system protein LptA
MSNAEVKCKRGLININGDDIDINKNKQSPARIQQRINERDKSKPLQFILTLTKNQGLDNLA